MRNQTLAWIAGGVLGLALFLMALAAWLAPAQALAEPDVWPWMPHMWAWGQGWPFMVLMMLGMVLFWVAVITGFVLLVRWLAQPRSDTPDRDEALEILRQRYARGEIEREEFEARRRELQRPA